MNPGQRSIRMLIRRMGGKADPDSRRKGEILDSAEQTGQDTEAGMGHPRTHL